MKLTTTTLSTKFYIILLLNLGCISLATANSNPVNDDKLPKPISYDYSGYCVEILEADKEVKQDNIIFITMSAVSTRIWLKAIWKKSYYLAIQRLLSHDLKKAFG